MPAPLRWRMVSSMSATSAASCASKCVTGCATSCNRGSPIFNTRCTATAAFLGPLAAPVRLEAHGDRAAVIAELQHLFGYLPRGVDRSFRARHRLGDEVMVRGKIAHRVRVVRVPGEQVRLAA